MTRGSHAKIDGETAKGFPQVSLVLAGKSVYQDDDEMGMLV